MTSFAPRYALAGLLAAAVALGAGELAAGLLDATSLVVAVADRVVDSAPAALLHFGIETFGRNDKPALLTGIVLVSLAIGAALGSPAYRSPVLGAAAFTLFGIVGILAEAGDPFASETAALIIGATAAAAGYVTLLVLLRVAGESEGAGDPAITMPGRATGGRRRFLAFAAAAAGAAPVIAVAGHRVGPSVDVEGQRTGIVLPPSTSNGTYPQVDELRVDGISELITPNDDFYRIDTAFVVPRVDVTSWRLVVKGMVAQPFELTFEELLAMPAIEEPVTLACVSNAVGGDLVGNAIWRGVPLAHILERAGIDPAATQIVGRSVDDFTVGFPTEVALDGRAAMVAYAMNGEPLPAVHGFPARLVVPGLYGYVSATKWLAEIELTTLDAFDAYWIPRGWAKQAAIKTQSRIDTPHRGRNVAAGRVPIAGVAWGGIRSISRVDVRITRSGASESTWHTAELGAALSSSTWRQWVVDDWDATPGEYRLEVRATDGAAAPQVEARTTPAPDGATGWHTVTVTVRAA